MYDLCDRGGTIRRNGRCFLVFGLGLLAIQGQRAWGQSDGCGSATVIGVGAYTGSTSGATNDGSATCGSSSSSPDVWFSYAAPSFGELTVDTCGSAYDTVLSIHSGCPGNSGNQLICNDDCGGSPCGGLQSCVTLAATGGATYLIRVAGYNGATGSFTLNVSLAGSSNDACVDAVSVGAGMVNGSTSGLTNDGSAGCGSSSTSADAWYSFTAPSDGNLTVNSCGSSFDAVLSLHSGCPGTGGNQIACNDNCGGSPCGSPQSCLSAAVTGGSAYLIRVSGFNGASGDFTLNIAFAGVGAGNDNCADAAAIGTGTFTGSTTTATNDGSASCGSSSSSRDVWYSFLAPSDGDLRLDTCGSAYDTVLSVHSGCPGTSANQIACNDDCSGVPCASLRSCLTVSVIQGTTYLIRVAGFSGASGDFTLNVNLGPPGVVACCFNDGTCQDLVPSACLSAGGDPRATGTNCSTFVCPPPVCRPAPDGQSCEPVTCPPPSSHCNCYFSSDCPSGTFCSYGPGGPCTQDICDWALPKPDGVIGGGCNNPVENCGPICDGACTGFGFGSECGDEDPSLIALATQLWGEAFTLPALNGGGVVDQDLAHQALMLPYESHACKISLGRQIGSIEALTRGQEFFQHPDGPHEMQDHEVVDIADQPCLIKSGNLAIQAMIAEIEAPGSGAAYIDLIPDYCPNWEQMFEPVCPTGPDALECVKDRIQGLAFALTHPQLIGPPMEECGPSAIVVDAAGNFVRISSCDCQPQGPCTIAYDPLTGASCSGDCDAGTECQRVVMPNGDGTSTITCDCRTPANQACCLPDGSCADMLQSACQSQGGLAQGAGSNCASTNCPAPCTAPVLLEARSVAAHDSGEYYVELDLSGVPAARTSEPRSAGLRVLDFVFDQPILSGSVTVSPGGVSALIAPGVGTGGANGGRADLGAALANNAVYSITVRATTGPGCDLLRTFCVAAQVGDFNDDDVVNAADKGELLGFVFQTVTQTNAKYDVSVGGGTTISVVDVGFWTGFFGNNAAGVSCP